MFPCVYVINELYISEFERVETCADWSHLEFLWNIHFWYFESIGTFHLILGFKFREYFLANGTIFLDDRNQWLMHYFILFIIGISPLHDVHHLVSYHRLGGKRVTFIIIPLIRSNDFIHLHTTDFCLLSRKYLIHRHVFVLWAFSSALSFWCFSSV